MRPPLIDLKFGHGTNGSTNHRLTDVLVVLADLADLGYDGVARPVFAGTVERRLHLAQLVDGHELFGITLNTGHAHCVEERPLLDCVRDLRAAAAQTAAAWAPPSL